MNAADALHYATALTGGLDGNAVCWLYVSASQGNARAQADYALMELNGTGTPVNHADSFIWAKKAAEQDDYQGEFIVAVAYLKGDGVAKDPAQADYWRKKALGHPEFRQMAATVARKQLAQQNQPTPAQIEGNAIATFLDDYIGAPMRRGDVKKAMSNLDKLGAIPPAYPCSSAEKADPRINCKARDDAYDAWEKQQEANPIQK